MDTENKIRILLVEDNPDDCKWYQNCYSVIPGVELSVVNTMTEGVRAVRERRPDALILDHQLTEGKSSIDLLEEIRTFVNLDEIPSVTLMRTGSGPVEDIYTWTTAPRMSGTRTIRATPRPAPTRCSPCCAGAFPRPGGGGCASRGLPCPGRWAGPLTTMRLSSA